MRVPSARCDVKLMHRANALAILIFDGSDVAASIFDVSPYPPEETNVVVGVDVEPEVERFPQRRHGKDENALNDDDGRGLDMPRCGQSRVCRKIVLGTVDGEARSQRIEIAAEALVVERIRFVEVDGRALQGVERAAIEVVPVVLDERRRSSRQAFEEATCNGRLATARAAGDAEDERAHAPA